MGTPPAAPDSRIAAWKGGAAVGYESSNAEAPKELKGSLNKEGQ
jgi:hypothetical protein